MREVGCNLRLHRHGFAAAAVFLVLLAATSACSFTTGSTESEVGWRTKVDQTLGTGVSSLGTAALLLESQANGHLSRNFVVVGMRDALTTLETDAKTFVVLQPPPNEQRASRQAVTALGRARAVLVEATTAATKGDTGERAAALRDVRRSYTNLQELSDKLVGR